MARAAINRKLKRPSTGMLDSWMRDPTSKRPASDAVAYSKDKEIAAPVSTTIATSSKDAPKPVAADAPFPTNQFFPTTDADAYSFSNLPEAGDDGAPV